MDPRKAPVYISTDVEFDGPHPDMHSMRSIGAVAYREDGKELGRFYVNLKPLPNHAPDPHTTKDFWEKPEQQAAWEALQHDQREPAEAMQTFADWIGGFTGQPVLVAQPFNIEQRWLGHYFKEFNIEWPFTGGDICMRELLLEAMEMLGKDEPAPEEEWLSRHPYTHISLDDAIFQGETFMNMKAWMEQRRAPEAGVSR